MAQKKRAGYARAKFALRVNGYSYQSEIEIGKSITIEGRTLYIVTIDSCEYIAHGIGANFGLLTHKGNCKNHKQVK